MTLSSEDGYAQAERFGNPFRVAESYKAKLRNGPQINDGDSHGLQEFSDLLARCEGAMKSIKYMDELNSAKTLQEVGAKLPSYIGAKWCRRARDIHKREESAVLFLDLVNFVKKEAELATDPIFSPESLKKERLNLKSSERTRGKNAKLRTAGASSFVSSSLARSSPVSRREGPSKGGQKSERPSSPCPICGETHCPAKCPKLKERSIADRTEIIRCHSLCFGCLRKGHQSRNCRNRLTYKECGKQHPTILHDTAKQRSESSSGNRPDSSPAYSHQVSTLPENVDQSPNYSQLTVCSSVTELEVPPIL